MLDLVLVIPTLNERGYIEEMLTGSIKLLDPLFKNYLIVVVDASSTDGTDAIVRGIMKGHPQVRLLQRKRRGQRGADVMYGMSKYRSRLYSYVDVDLAPSLHYLKKLLALHDEGFDLVTGSRYLDASVTNRPPLRRFVSKCYNSMINVVFGDEVKDHQIGFKLFDDVAFDLMRKECRERHWAWDPEAVLVAHYNHLRIKEVPISWTERRNTRTSIRRLSKDILIFTPSLFRMFYRFRISHDF